MAKTAKSAMSWVSAGLVISVGCGVAMGQWNPSQRQWGKEDPTDLRVMTWNVEDMLVSTHTLKVDTFASDWNACVHVIAALQPDVLILQEAGDRDGQPNATGSGVDSVAVLEATARDFLTGVGGATANVQVWAPGYNLPFVHASSVTDNFNRNVILSRYPFADLSGDGVAFFDQYVIRPGTDVFGGSSGIRGFMWAEIDLPDDVYAGDFIVGNAHLKAGSTSGDLADRLNAAENAAFFIDHYWNGAGSGMVDPTDRLLAPGPTTGVVIPAETVIAWGGDWNEDENTNGRVGPALLMTQGLTAGGTDGLDLDRTDAVFDSATNVQTGSRNTRGGSKLDYMAWMDSRVLGVRRQFVYSSAGNASFLPFPISRYPTQPLSVSSLASDHLPVVIDFVMARAEPPACPADFNGDTAPGDIFDLFDFLAALDGGLDFNGDTTPADIFDLFDFLAVLDAGCP